MTFASRMPAVPLSKRADLQPEPPPSPRLPEREDRAIHAELTDGFCRKYQFHLGGTLASAAAIVWLLAETGSLPLLLSWFGVAVAACAFMAWAYRCDEASPNRENAVDQRSMSTALGGLTMGAVAWLDLEALQDSVYAYALCACLVAYAAGTVINLQPLSFLVQVTVFPALVQAAIALAVVGQFKPAVCLTAFLAIVGFRPLDVGRLQLEAVVRERERESWRADHDAMTGLLNRAGAEERLRPGQSLLYLDIDDFKQINDVYGHHGGDRVLARIGEVLRSVTAPYGADAARLGGDEFLVFASGLEPGAVEQLADSIVEGLSDSASMGQNVRVSIGIAKASGCLETSIARADAALYRAKADPNVSIMWANQRAS